jgi:hypothetical protein
MAARPDEVGAPPHAPTLNEHHRRHLRQHFDAQAQVYRAQLARSPVAQSSGAGAELALRELAEVGTLGQNGR